MDINLSEIIPQYKINSHNPDTRHNPHDGSGMRFTFLFYRENNNIIRGGGTDKEKHDHWIQWLDKIQWFDKTV